MKAIEYKKYGTPEVFELNEISKPTPKANEILIKMYATTVTAADIMMRKGEPVIGRLYLGVKRPKRTVLGFDVAGEVVEIGNEVKLFKVGDKVFGGTTTLGCYAEYVCVKANDVITTMPSNTSYEEASAMSGSGITVWNFLVAKAKIQKGQKVLINGASGALGTYAVQLAKHFEAEVTGVCSTINMDLVKSLGADYVIDYTKEDFTKNRKQYDIIFDTIGKSSFMKCKGILTKKGIYLSSVASPVLFFQMIKSYIFGGRQAKTSATGLLPVNQRLEYLVELKELMKQNKIKTVIDRTYSLEKMTEAHQYVETGRKKGNVIIDFGF